MGQSSDMRFHILFNCIVYLLSGVVANIHSNIHKKRTENAPVINYSYMNVAAKA